MNFDTESDRHLALLHVEGFGALVVLSACSIASSQSFNIRSKMGESLILHHKKSQCLIHGYLMKVFQVMFCLCKGFDELPAANIYRFSQLGSC